LQRSQRKGFFTPEYCKSCEIYQKYPNRVIGWEVRTPLGLVKVSGCTFRGKSLCPYRHDQIIFLGINPGKAVSEIGDIIYNVLDGDRELTEESREIIKKFLLFGRDEQIKKKLAKANIPVEAVKITRAASQSYAGFYLLYPDFIAHETFCGEKREPKKDPVMSIDFSSIFGWGTFNICFDKKCVCFSSRVWGKAPLASSYSSWHQKFVLF